MLIPTINEIVSQLAGADPFDSQHNLELLESLQALRTELQGLENATALEGLDGGILLLNFHLHTEGEGGCELMSVLQRMLKYVQISVLQTLEAASTRGAVRLGGRDKIDPVEVVHDMQLGQILLSMGYISEDDIYASLALGRETGIPFGEALIQNNVVGEAQVRESLCFQQACRDAALTRKAGQVQLPQRRSPGQRVIKMRSPEGPDVSLGLKLMTDVMLGEILVRGGLIQRWQLNDALLCQRATGVRLGEALVAAGACHWSDVEGALETQAQMRRSH